MSQLSGLVGDFGAGDVIEEIAGVPLEEFGDTMRIEGVVVGNGHTRKVFLLPGEATEWSTYGVTLLTTPQALAWLAQSDDPIEPIYRDNTKIVKAVVRKAKRQVDQNVAWAVYARAGYECEYCGATGVPLTYDHWLAQAFGGLTTLENGVSACRPCNKAKGHLTKAEWVTFMEERGYEYASRWAERLAKEQAAN